MKNIKHDGNITKDTLFNIARQMRFKSQAKEFKGTVPRHSVVRRSSTLRLSLPGMAHGEVKEILGTAFAVGCTVDGKKPMDVMEMVDNGELACPTE